MSKHTIPSGVSFLARVTEPNGKTRTISRKERSEEPPTERPTRPVDSASSVKQAMEILREGLVEDDSVNGWTISPSDSLNLGSIDLP